MVRRTGVPVVMGLLVTLAALPLTRIFHGGLLTRLLLGAALIPLALSALVRRLPAYTAAPISAAFLFGYTLLAVRVSAHDAGLPGSVPALWRDAAHNGIPRLLTALIPVEPQPDTVLVPVVATWLAALAGAELAVRFRRMLAGYAPVTVLYAGTLLVVGPNARPALWQPLAYATLAAAGLALTARPAGAAAPDLDARARAALRARLAVSAAAALAVIVGLSVAVGPALAGRVTATPMDPRRYVSPPDLSAQDENPLIRLSGWALNPTEKLFDTDITTTVPAADLRIRLAVLSDYDGVNWLVHGDYREAGRALPPIDGPGAPPPGGRPIDTRITVRDLDGRLLPAAESAREVGGVRVGYDQGTGTLIVPAGLSPGLTYTVRSQAAALNVNLLPGADVPSGPAVARYLQLGIGAPDAMTKLAARLGQDVAAPYQRAQAIADFLSDHYTLVSDAPSGHAYPNLDFFLFAARNLGGQRGTTEQFAASFAVLGRMLGLPTRVVVGFTARPGHGSVLGRDALAWPEVLFTGVGWVPFDPLPHPGTAPRPVEDDFAAKPPPSPPPPSPAPTVAASASAKPHSPSPSPSVPALPAAGVSGGLLGGLGGGLLALLGAALAGVGFARRALRRRRLERGSPSARVAGAWHEVLDGLRLAGRPAAAHLAVTEVAAFAAEAVAGPRRSTGAGSGLPAPSLDDLATLANRVAFAGAQVREEDARRARAQALAYVGELRARRPWWRRLLWWVDPRPLRWDRSEPPGSRPATGEALPAGGPPGAG
jgi:transglutaminase-like putative cysteine protease